MNQKSGLKFHPILIHVKFVESKGIGVSLLFRRRVVSLFSNALSHLVQSCPSKPESESKPIHASLSSRDTSQCWFCLSNPSIETHLILGILDSSYIALAKGGINSSHVLVVPIVHHASSVDMFKQEAGGLEQVVKQMAGCCEKDQVVFAWEGFGGGSGGAGVNERLHHYHINVVFVSRKISESVFDRVKKEAQDAGMCERNATVGEGFIRVGVYDGKDALNGGNVSVQESVLCMQQDNGGARGRIPLNLVRRVIVKELGLPIYTMDWKKCVLEKEEEEENTNEGRQRFKVLLDEEDEE